MAYNIIIFKISYMTTKLKYADILIIDYNLISFLVNLASPPQQIKINQAKNNLISYYHIFY